MKIHHIDILCCPMCKGDLQLSNGYSFDKNNDRVRNGFLSCVPCKKKYPIKKYIPSFLIEEVEYSDSFSEQWIKFNKTQIDSKNILESEIRFKSEISSFENLKNKNILEIGSGAGRFLNVISKKTSPKLIVGIDPSDAVYSSFESLKESEVDFLIAKCSVYNLPFKRSFDLVYSIGVLHHTPDPFLSFKCMTMTAKESARVAVSVYENSLYPRPNKNSIGVLFNEFLWSLNLLRVEIFRVFTTKIPFRLMFYYCKFFIPILHKINRIPVIRFVRYLFPSTCYKNLPVEWSMVDTMDTYSTQIVHQYRCKDIYNWFRTLQFSDISVMNSRAGWVSINGEVNNLVINRKEIKISSPKPI